MRRRLAYALAVVFSIVSFGAAQGPHKSESGYARVIPVSVPTHFRQAHKKPFQIGTASWYGEYFQGKETASGEAYNMYDLTAAHPSLPLGTLVRVTNLRNGRSVTVRVNDRGPVVEGRIIDLSYGAARALKFKDKGLQRVRLDLLPAEPPVLMARLAR